MFETGRTSTRQPLAFSFVSRSVKRYSTKSSSFERTTRLVEHYTACEHAQSKSTQSRTNKSSKWWRARTRTRSKKLSKIRPQMAEQKEESGQSKKLIYLLTFWKNIVVSGMSIVKNTTSEMFGSELTRK